MCLLVPYTRLLSYLKGHGGFFLNWGKIPLFYEAETTSKPHPDL
jgi:hypothetical protein